MVKILMLKREESELELCDSETIVESYSFGNNIDFSLLLDYLMKDGFENSFALSDASVTDQTDEEKNLFSLLRQIVQAYNDRQASFNAFKKEKDAR